MSVLIKISAACLMAVSAFAFAGPASAQPDVDAVRAKCIDQAVRSFPGTAPEGPESRARVETYISCMRQHGVNP